MALVHHSEASGISAQLVEVVLAAFVGEEEGGAEEVGGDTLFREAGDATSGLALD